MNSVFWRYSILLRLKVMHRKTIKVSKKERNLSFCTLYGVWGYDFHKKFQILEKSFILFYFIKIFMLLLLLHKPLKAVGTFRANIVPTFVSKVTKNLCSGCFFSSDKF